MAKPRWLDERQQHVWQGYLHVNQNLFAVLEQELAVNSDIILLPDHDHLRARYADIRESV